MKRYFRVATLSQYVLVEAKDEIEACRLGQTALNEQFPGLMLKAHIRTITPATPDEIEFWEWHQEMLARERGQQA